jgi:hypothetical protein
LGLAGCGARLLLSADGGQFPLDLGADRGVGAQGFEASRELIGVQVELAGGEPTHWAVLLRRGGHGNTALTEDERP